MHNNSLFHLHSITVNSVSPHLAYYCIIYTLNSCRKINVKEKENKVNMIMTPVFTIMIYKYRLEYHCIMIANVNILSEVVGFYDFHHSSYCIFNTSNRYRKIYLKKKKEKSKSPPLYAATV